MTKIISTSTDQLSKITPPRLEAIDGLRGVACLMVVAHHCYFHGGRYAYPELNIGSWKTIALSQILFYGYSGVELFFVLSGFCLAYPILNRLPQTPNWRRYFVSRIRRIYPPFLIAMVLFGICAWLIQYLQVEPFFSARVLAIPSFRQFIYSILFISLSFNTSFWTLCVEWRWYFVLPLLITLYFRFKMLGILAFTTSVSLFYVFFIQSSNSEQVKFLLSPLPLFLPVFALGIWSAELATSKHKSTGTDFIIQNIRWGCLASLFFLLIVVPREPNLNLTFSRAIPFGLLYFFVVLAAIYDPVIRQILSWKPLVILGEFSYSLYLIHLPLIHAAYSVTQKLNWSPATQFLFYQGAFLPFCILLGYLFYQVAEKPFLRQRTTINLKV